MSPFDETYSRLSPQEFIDTVLIDKLKARLVVAGFNYRFGYKGKGDVEYLKKNGDKLGFRVIVVPPVKVKSEIVSSTIIRSYIKKGRMERVFQLLGRHFSLYGTVVCGKKKVGRTLDFLQQILWRILPWWFLQMGYISQTKYDDKWINSITNVGIAPTVKEDRVFSIETHLLDYNEDIYGRNIEVCFIQKLREEKNMRV